jgi:alpha-L-fucosidase 2
MFGKVVALPDCVAIGGFQLVSMEWKEGKVVKAVIKSTLGGNLRLRTHNAMKLSTGGALKKATGRNKNPFYYVEETPAAIISDKASVAPPDLKETLVYDLPTQAGKTAINLAIKIQL